MIMADTISTMACIVTSTNKVGSIKTRSVLMKAKLQIELRAATTTMATPMTASTERRTCGRGW